MGAQWRQDPRECLYGWPRAFRACRAQWLRRTFARETPLLPVFPNRRKLPRSRGGSAWRSRQRCSCRTWKRQSGPLVALRPLRSTAELVRAAVSADCQLGDRRWQCRANIGTPRGQLPTLCTGAPQLPITVPGYLRWRQRPRAALVVGDGEGISRPVGNDSIVKIRKDHIVCSGGLQVMWRTDPHRNRDVNRRRQQKRCLRQFWRGKLGELRRRWRQKAFWNRRRRREVVSRVAEENCRLLHERTFVRWRRRNIVGNRIRIRRWL